MAKRRRSQTGKRKSKPSLPTAAEVVAFTDVDEAFFAAGTALEERASPASESFDDAEHPDDVESGRERPSFWRRLFARTHAV